MQRSIVSQSHRCTPGPGTGNRIAQSHIPSKYSPVQAHTPPNTQSPTDLWAHSVAPKPRKATEEAPLLAHPTKEEAQKSPPTRSRRSHLKEAVPRHAIPTAPNPHIPQEPGHPARARQHNTPPHTLSDMTIVQVPHDSSHSL